MFNDAELSSESESDVEDYDIQDTNFYHPGICFLVNSDQKNIHNQRAISRVKKTLRSLENGPQVPPDTIIMNVSGLNIEL